MKTAAKIYLAALLGAGIIPAAPAFAQVMGDAATGVGAMAQDQAHAIAQGGQVQSQTQAQLQAQAAAQAQVQAANQANPSGNPAVQTATTNAAAMPPVAAPDMGAALPGGDANTLPGATDDPSKSEIKVPQSVKNVVKRLDTGTDKVTLDDLNSAREAVAKLDVLLDIEKRLSDLANIRREREEKSMATAIPASAFGMPMGRGGMMPPPMPSYPPIGAAAPPPMGMAMMNNDPDVLRITGANGHYVVTIKGNDGKNLRLREGDKLPDGSTIETISSQGVTILRDKTKHTLHVKDVGTVFGGR